MLPTASTRTRAWVLAVLAGIVTPWLPSFGVLASSTIGNVLPPSVDKVMRTLAVLTGAAVVDATFQVTVCAEPEGQLTAVFGAVTANGPAAVVTVTLLLASFVPPPPARLSRAVTQKVIVRFVLACTSPTKKFG